jgi:hypothetical protein
MYDAKEVSKRMIRLAFYRIEVSDASDCSFDPTRRNLNLYDELDDCRVWRHPNNRYHG